MTTVLSRRDGLLGLLGLVTAAVLWGIWTSAKKYALTRLPVITVLGLTLVVSGRPTVGRATAPGSSVAHPSTTVPAGRS